MKITGYIILTFLLLNAQLLAGNKEHKIAKSAQQKKSFAKLRPFIINKTSKKGEKMVVIKKFQTLSVDFDMPKNIAKIDIQNGGTLIVKSGAAVMLDVPIVVENGGTLIMEENSLVTMGSFTINHGGTFNIYKKSILRLLSTTNTCKGNLDFNVDGASSADQNKVVAISSGQKDNMCDVASKNFSQIICTGHLSNYWVVPPVVANTLKIQYTDFENVAIKAIGYENLPEIKWCNFYTNTSELFDQNNNFTGTLPNSFLEILSRSYDLFGGGYKITNCTFKVKSSTIDMNWLTSDNPNESAPNFNHHLNGVAIFGGGFILSGLDNFGVVISTDTIPGCNVTIDNSDLNQFGDNPDYSVWNNIDNQHFYGLNCAVSTTFCGKVLITHCNVANCRQANIDYCASVKLCQNSTFRVNTVHSLNGSKLWGTFDNKFHQSNKAANLIDVLSGQNFRSNYFDDYFNGVFMNYSRANFRGTYVPNTQQTNTYVLGRNEFQIPIQTDQLPPNGNPFITLSNQSIDSRSDFFFFNYPDPVQNLPDTYDNFDGKNPLKIQCGINQLGLFTPMHLYYSRSDQNAIPKPVIQINVNANKNNWRNNPNNSIKYLPDYFTLLPPPSDIQTPGSRTDYIGCDESLTETACGTLNPPMTCDFFVHNTGNWPSTNIDTVLDNDFYALLHDFCAGPLACPCYRQRLFDLMQLAVLGDSSDDKIKMVINCLLTKVSGNDAVYNYLNCNVSDLLLLLGEAYERRGLADSALNAYYYILTNSHNPADTTLARWRVLNIEAVQADTTFGAVYDSLMSLYYQRVDRDITTTYQGGSPPYGRIAANVPGEKPPVQQQEIKNEDDVIARLDQNSPNPFTDETVITFYLYREADVRLGVHDALGQTIREVVNQRLRKGKYIYTFQNEGRADGVYLYMLTTDGKQIVKKMQLIK